MEINVNFLDKLRLEAKFDDFTVVADQPIRYKGDGSAPGPAPDGAGEPLYAPLGTWRGRPRTPARLRAIPYFAWANRGPAAMRVWIARSGR